MARPDAKRFSWRWIARSLLLRRRQAGLLFVLSMVVFASGLVFPIAIQKAVDRIVAHRLGLDLPLLAIAVGTALVIECHASRVRQNLVNELGIFLDRRISRLTVAHILRARLDTRDFTTGDVMNRLEKVEKIHDFVLHYLPDAIFDVGGAAIALGAIFFYDVPVGLALLIATPLFALMVTSRLRGLRAGYETVFPLRAAQQNVLSETVTGIATVKALAVESNRMRRWTSTTDAFLDGLRAQLEKEGAFGIASQVASRLLALLVVVVGCWRLEAGHISVGDLLALQVLAGRVTGPLLTSGDVFAIYQRTDVAIDEIDRLMSAPRERAAVHPPVRAFASSGIVVRNLSLTYPGATTPALAGLDFDLPSRGVVALIGRNGSGKSTMIKILLGMRQDYEGRVEIAGEDIRDYDPRWLRAQFGVVNQDTVLFSGTIRDNLASGQIVDDATLEDALRFADALDFVRALPEGIDTEIKAGATLSGGQRQRLAIARAMIRDPRIALFDEPGAFLDAEAAVALERRLTAWAKDRLVILVTHHLLATRTADKIIVLDQGRCVGQGTHDVMLRDVPEYATLWDDYNRNADAVAA